MIMRSLRENMRWILMGFVVVFVLSIFGMYGFGGRRESSKEEGIRDYAVAEISGKKVMRSALEANVRDYVERNNIKEISSNDLMAIRQAVVDNMAIQTELAKAVEKSGVKASDQEVEDVVKQISTQFPTKEAFQKHLDDNGIKLDALKASIQTQLSQQKLIEQSAGSIVVTPEEVKDFYDKGKTVFFTRPAGKKVVFARFANKESAEKVYEGLKSDSSKWDALLKDVASEDVKESVPYDAPIFLAESNLRDKMEGIKDLPVGGVAAPIEITSNDVMVVLNKESMEKSTLSFDEVSKDIKALLTNQKKEEGQMKYINSLKEGATIKILDPSIFPQPVEEKAAEEVTKPASGDENASKTESQTETEADKKN